MISECLAKIAADGRLTTPKPTLQILTEKEEKTSPAPSSKSPSTQERNRGVASTAEEAPPESPEAKILGKIKDIRNLHKATS